MILVLVEHFKQDNNAKEGIVCFLVFIDIKNNMVWLKNDISISIIVKVIIMLLISWRPFNFFVLKESLKGLAQAKIIRKSVILFRVPNMTI